MAFDQQLGDRVRAALDGVPDVTERRMFGGLAFMVAGHMACGVLGDEMIVRLGDDGADAALDEPHTRPMDFTGRPSRSMVYVERAGLATDADLTRWVRAGVGFAQTLPPKRSPGRLPASRRGGPPC